ncbi:hypothetical protein [Acinetobacter nosocomialis]|uniref:hypothetical protein n=2 Tax=Acinetobacter calcoaceticus/baumannii complex TaxID=909768 RepID=UPI003AF8201E
MSSFFADFERVTIFSVPYKYEPLILFVKSIKELKKLSSGESQISIVLEQSIKLLNKIISVKKINEEEIQTLKKSCKRLRVRGYHSEIMNVAKIISDMTDFIKIDQIIINTLEELILNNNEDIYGLLVESENQWNDILPLLKENELHIFLRPILIKDIREKYFDIPIITFIPLKWISGLIVLPFTECFYVVHHVDSFVWRVDSSIFIAPNGNSIETSSENYNLVKNDLINIKSSKEFYSKYSLFYDNDLTIESDTSSLIIVDDYNYKLEIRDKNNEIQHIEYNKEYLIVTKDNKIKYSIFENDDQLINVKYIVCEIDTSFLSSDDFKRHQNLIMEKWKNPLRQYSDIDLLVKKLKKLGAKKATPQNVKNWSNLENIAPRDHNDYKAVLLLAGITDSEEIERFFDFARKRRGVAISDGYYQKNIGLEIVREYLENIKNSESLDLVHQVQGIKFLLIPLG